MVLRIQNEISPMLKLAHYWRHHNEQIAAIDLGSNSFHMILATVEKGQINIIDRLKEPVRLGFGLTDDGTLDESVQQKAYECLRRFRQRIKHLPANRVRAVGTRTLRQAHQAKQFLSKANEALGYKIQVISGHEEARLIYQGVAFGLEDDQQQRLVIDIGGGSTELLIGTGVTPIMMESLGMGCVSVSKLFFSDGNITADRIRKAHLHSLQKLEPFAYSFCQQGWQRSIGCSGSIKSIAKILKASQGHPLITQQGIEELVQKCIAAQTIDQLDFAGLSSQRKPVFLGGLLVLRACMSALNLTQMESSPWALREGVLYDMIGHNSLADLRTQSVKKLASRFHTDQQHAEQTAKVAQTMFCHVEAHFQSLIPWSRYLYWACLLQEVGLEINHDKFHHHGAYIIQNAHLAGFGYDEQTRLAQLVRNQRKKPDWSLIESIPDDEKRSFILILHIFRLANVFTRARNDIEHTGWHLNLKGNTLTFVAPNTWWQTHPLVGSELVVETQQMKKSPFQLELSHLPTQ